MATNYSLLVWGGKNGYGPSTSPACTCSGATFTLTAHGMSSYDAGRPDSSKVQFVGGTLPGNAASTTDYYVKKLTDNTFELYTNSDLTTGKLTTSSAGSGWVLKSSYYVGLSSVARWTNGGTEDVYGTLSALLTARAAATGAYDLEEWEVANAFVDTVSANVNINVSCLSVKVRPMIDGEMTDAHHKGSRLTGYVLTHSVTYSTVLTLGGQFVTFSDMNVQAKGSNTAGAIVGGNFCNFERNYVHGASTTTGGGIGANGKGCLVTYNTVTNFGTGISGLAFASDVTTVANNTVAKCGTGMPGGSNVRGWWYNNISVGCTTNWGATAPSQANGMGFNAGVSGDSPWGANSISTLTTNSSTFVDYTNNDFDLTSTATAIDAGTVVATITELMDNKRRTVPNYEAGGVMGRDIGAFEFDHGEGNAPVEWTVEWDIDGSTVRVFETGTQTIVDSATSGTTLVITAGTGSVYDLTVEKDGYLRVRMTGITASDGLETTVPQEVDFAYAASSGLTYATNADFSGGEFSLSAASSVQNFYSFWVETFRTESTYYNTDFPLQANGPFSIKLLSGNEFDGSTSIGYLHTGGIAYVNSSGTTVAQWMGLQTSGVPSGMSAQWAWSDGGTAQSAASSGDINDLIQIYGDASHGNFDYRSYMVLKAQGEDGSSNLYNQAEVDIVDQYGTLSDSLYVVGLVPSDTGVDYAAPGGTPTITDHGASPVSWNSKSWSITIQTDLTGDQLLAYLRHNSTITVNSVSDQRFDYHDLIQPVGDSYKTVRGVVYGDTGASLKGVRVLSGGGSAHSDFSIMTADDGTTYTAPQAATVSITGLVAGSRVQIYDTLNSVELFNDIVAGTSTLYSETYTIDRTIRLRIANVDGVTAYGFVETTLGTISTSNYNLSYLANQTVDSVYNTNAVDGSTVTDISFVDASPDRIEIALSSAGTFTLKSIYAAWVYYAFTEIGIATDIDYIRAIDPANYETSNILIKNTSSPSASLKLTGGYIWDADTLDPMDVIDESGGTLFLAPPHVVSNTVIVSGSSVITGDIADVLAAIPSTSDNATAVWADSKALTVPKFIALK